VKILLKEYRYAYQVEFFGLNTSYEVIQKIPKFRGNIVFGFRFLVGVSLGMGVENGSWLREEG
jgi:hypothetical protein